VFERVPHLRLLPALVVASVASAQQATDIEARIARLEAENDEFRRRLGLLADEQERLTLGSVATPIGARVSGLAPAASKVYGASSGVSIGGYGEANFTDFDASRDDGSRSGASDRADFLRLVTYVGYKFDDTWLFNSEIEYEHGSTENGGSVSVEFAYLDGLFDPAANLRVGLLLVPMGFVNEQHEPTTFYGAIRPRVERVLLPSTWRENGVGAWGDVGDFSYRTYVLNGMDASGFEAGGIRDGRQNGAKALAEDFAWVGRVDWRAAPGLTVGASAYIGDSGQEQFDVDVSTTIYEAHAEWRWRGWGVRALYAATELDDVAALNNALSLSGVDSIGERMNGGYLEAGYDLSSIGVVPAGQSLTPFARFERYDTQADVPLGFASSGANDVEVATFGVAYQPHPQLVFKLDYSNFKDDANTGVDEFHAGLGFVF